MWFKNLVVYRLPADWSVAPAELEEKLAQRSLQPCGSFDMQSRGWVHASAAAFNRPVAACWISFAQAVRARR